MNASLAWSRTQKKRRHRHQPLSAFSEIPDPGGESYSTVQNNSMVERLYIEVRKLAPADRSLVLLYLDQLSYREMAEILGISPDNVGVRLNRIKKRLCESLGGVDDGS
jgi:RNA polymerase sigma-70 factor (ECF subfamily)